MEPIKIAEWTLEFRNSCPNGWSNYKLSRPRKGEKKPGVMNSFFLSHNGERFARRTDANKLLVHYPGLYAKVNEALQALED